MGRNMNNGCLGRKIGFALNSIHFGSSLKLWVKLANFASKENGSFFIFPGGHLNREIDSDLLRNDIYKLCNSENFDGIISWASSIANGVDSEKITGFHLNFGKVPVVTIGEKILDFPNISFDAYSGMKELTGHFIHHHGARKIAYIRGPENHISENERFQGFAAAAKEAGIFDENLVSGNTSWLEGWKGARELYEEKNLVPGKDFDAVLSASDLMTLSAVEYFDKLGYTLLKDYIAGGFNDSAESKIYTPPFSTVYIPMEKIGIAAYEHLRKVLDGEKNVDDVCFPTYSVIRESCGCNRFKIFQNLKDQKIRIKTRDQLLEKLGELFRLEPEKIESLLVPLLDALFENNQSDFFRQLNELFVSYFENDGELSNLFTAVKYLYNSTCLPEEYVEKIANSIVIQIPQIQGRIVAQRIYDNGKLMSNVSALKSALLSAHDKKTLIKILAEYLPRIGIRNSQIVLYESDEISRYVGGFNSSGEIRQEEVLFPSKMLIPAKYEKEIGFGVYLVQPLYMAEKSLGYIIMSYADFDCALFEDLRTAISNAVQSILLFEEINVARKLAEQSEFAKTEFFANVGSDLCDPLKDLSAKVTQMEGNVLKGVLDQDTLSDQLIFLKSQIEAQLQKTQTLVDLTRSQVDDLPMDKKLFEIRQILPGSVVASFEIGKEFPLVYGDTERLKKAVQTFFGDGEGSMSVSVEFDGLKLKINAKRLDWQKLEILLAEKIIMLQYGEVEKIGDCSAVITLPWPNLAGLPPVKIEGRPEKIINLSAKNQNTELFGIKTEYLQAERSEDENAMLLWRPDKSPIDEWVKVYGLRHSDRLFRAPVLCYSHELVGHNFVEMLESQVRSQKSEPVLFVNTKHTLYGTWATESNSVKIQSMAEFDGILNEITPSLIVFESIDEESIVKIRRNSKTVLVPILVLPDSILKEEEVELLCAHPRIILCNRCAAESEQFNERIHSILSGDEILPPHTGALVKKAILYFNKNASQQIVRWKLADSVHVSEDYLTRIFHKEIGLSLWEYLNRYRIYLATKMLLETNDTIYEIAENSGFQDQAYFCRVFKKIYGVPPGKIRTKQ